MPDSECQSRWFKLAIQLELEVDDATRRASVQLEGRRRQAVTVLNLSSYCCHWQPRLPVSGTAPGRTTSSSHWHDASHLALAHQDTVLKPGR